MDAQLAQISALNQKDKGPAFIALIPEILSCSDPSRLVADLHKLVDTVVNQDSVGLVVGRQVLSELVKILGECSIKDAELRRRVVEDTLSTVQPRIVSYEEQVCLEQPTMWPHLIDILLRSTPCVSSLQIYWKSKKIGVILLGCLWVSPLRGAY